MDSKSVKKSEDKKKIEKKIPEIKSEEIVDSKEKEKIQEDGNLQNQIFKMNEKSATA